MKNKIILFYKYVNIQHPKSTQKEQFRLCQDLGLKGRIILAEEGINGTLGGPIDKIETYKKIMDDHDLFNNIDFKESEGSADDFPRLRIVIKNEIVHLGCDPQEVTCKDGGQHVSPEEAHHLMEEAPEDLVILDTRNDYEARIGTFVHKKAPTLIPPKKNFREFPEYIDENLEKLKGKKVLMACTGGIRCERASAYVNKKGIAKKVYQINGGIHRYVEKYPDGYFRGKNYVFDSRIAIRVNDDILAECDLCCAPCDDYTNCINAQCNNHFIACNTCKETYNNSCSQECQQALVNGTAPKRKRPLPQPGVHK